MKYQMMELAGQLTPGHTDALWAAIDNILTSGKASGEDIVIIAREHPRAWVHNRGSHPAKPFELQFGNKTVSGVLTSEGTKVTHIFFVQQDGQRSAVSGEHYYETARIVAEMVKAGQFAAIAKVGQ
ncbi:hypothetical protein [Deinococcus sedimenti]|uniref:Uncharacterized protein n=1 Tax=Deinococcus sedimenti TaxID=1867090 RepID=A0ABQ2S349_9DEIO|nr:hypothetical protein [Deinococcus sedimenti]GGR84597.1 hypothetical protein GCM10008960_09540 [Deinococcus sedimenti]